MSEYEALKNYLESLPLLPKGSRIFIRGTGEGAWQGTAFARKYRPWWENEYSSETHSHARAWIQAGWKVDAFNNMEEEWVRFVRAGRRKWLQRPMSKMGGR